MHTQQAPDYPLSTCFQYKRNVVVNAHTFCQRSGKALSWEQYMKCLYTPSFIKNQNLLCSACDIHQRVGLVVYLRNKLSRTKRNSQSFLHKSLLSSLTDDWSTGLVKARSKQSITALCSHIYSMYKFRLVHIHACTQTHTHIQ